ncbi:ribitol-5-phosphate transferase FKTN-like isoform X2 [Oscarella lobularis]|uniref:ribitol-5-phosphate transferase FKTN-like isoform X2 n=1 Tax=Oscarella lobularis TaxID=121494 RepID=UPI0033139EAE
MKKRSAVYLLAAISALFLFCQLAYVFYSNAQPSLCDEMLAFSTHFASIAAQHDIALFLVDPDVIALWSTSPAAHRTRRGWVASRTNVDQYCQRQSVTLGVMETDWPSSIVDKYRLKLLLDAYVDAGFRYVNVTGLDPKLSASFGIAKADPVPYHYLIWRDRVTVHLVVFYERGVEAYLWHGSTDLAKFAVHYKRHPSVIPSEGDDVVTRHFPLTAGAYQKFDFASVAIGHVFVQAPRNATDFLLQLAHSQFVECSAERARQFASKNSAGVDLSADDIAYLEQAKEIIRLGKTVLNDIGIPFWLSSGTCLGWFRQCGVIPYGKDVDFGVFIRDYQSRLTQAMINRGFTLKHVFGKVSDSFELSFVRFGVKLDLFFFYEESDHVWNGGTQAKSGKKFNS